VAALAFAACTSAGSAALTATDSAAAAVPAAAPAPVASFHLNLPPAVSVGGDTGLTARGGAAAPLVTASDAAPAHAGPTRWQWPAESHTISDPFGLPRGTGNHTGIDIVGGWQSPVFAAASGVVVFADDAGPTYGLSVVIHHPNGLLSRYAHLSGIYPEAGDAVDAGQIIGQMGDSGHAFGTHLHFEVLTGGGYLDPLSVLLGGQR
jgi:murein DD-endopeptidase MepM/ murein hydrolase activator NlpD